MNHKRNSCPCDGSNENCYRCYGTGVIGGLMEVLLHKPDTTPKESNQDISPKKWEKSNSESESNHSKRRKQTPAPDTMDRTYTENCSPFVPMSDYELCPECGVKVRSLDFHVNRLHTKLSVQPTGKPKQDRTSTKANEPGFLACPKCQTPVNASKLNTHMFRVHKRYLTTYQIYLLTSGSEQVSKTQKSPASSRGKTRKRPHSQSYNTELERQLDATRLYAHAYREGGRYGSHPSHDDYDE